MNLDTIRGRCIEEGQCWLWPCLNGHGVPQGTINGARGINMRRHVYKLSGRSIRPGYCIRASCGQGACISPECLVQLTRGEVLKASYDSGNRRTPALLATWSKLAKKARSLTDEQANQIRGEEGTYREKAQRWGISKTAVANLCRGETYRPKGASVFSYRP